MLRQFSLCGSASHSSRAPRYRNQSHTSLSWQPIWFINKQKGECHVLTNYVQCVSQILQTSMIKYILQIVGLPDLYSLEIVGIIFFVLIISENTAEKRNYKARKHVIFA